MSLLLEEEIVEIMRILTEQQQQLKEMDNQILILSSSLKEYGF